MAKIMARYLQSRIWLNYLQKETFHKAFEFIYGTAQLTQNGWARAVVTVKIPLHEKLAW